MNTSTKESKSSAWFPSGFEPSSYGICVDSCFSAPLGDTLSFPVVRYPDSVRAIGVLFSGSGPFAIFWRVIAIRINSVYREAVRRLSHIIPKGYKCPPSVAHFNAFTEIVFAVRVPASRVHSKPNVIKSCSGHAMIGFVATAGLGVSSNKCASSPLMLGSAIATTQPRQSFGAIPFPEHRELTKTEPGEIVCGAHAW